MKTPLKVIKADGAAEDYLHTKVIGTINNALDAVNQADIRIAEQLADVVTYYIYQRQKHRSVTTNEIFSIIKAVLTSTDHEDAAVELSESHFERKLKRCRIEVVSVDIQDLADAEKVCKEQQSHSRSRWDKGRIVDDLVTEHGVSQQTARTIASMVEEKIFNMGITLVPASLIRQLVLSDAAVVLRAQEQLQAV
ncbi:MAG: hypothetical protein JSU70_00180 [Phycisphaerales bacterium]|nr:MAG: hypothetical protein JSU70_00180 [Phycisphaerales bacterium]